MPASLKRFDGTDWVASSIKPFDGADFASVTSKVRWDGAWIDLDGGGEEPAGDGIVVSSVSDNFNDNSVDLGLWEVDISGPGMTITETNQRLEISAVAPFADSADATLFGIVNLNLVDKLIAFDVIEPFGISSFDGDSSFAVRTSASNGDRVQISWSFDGTDPKILFRTMNGGSPTDTEIVWDSAVAKVAILHNSDGTPGWKYYTRDASTWTLRATHAAAWSATSMLPRFSASIYGAGEQGNSLIVDNLVIGTFAPPSALFSDDFNDNSIDVTKWSTYNWNGHGYVGGSGGTVISETGGQLVLDPPSDTPGNQAKAIRTVDPIDFTGRTLEFDIVQCGGESGETHCGMNLWELAANDNAVNLEFSFSTTTMQVAQSYSQDFIYDIDYTITKWRIVHNDGDNTYQFWSYDGSWTLRFTSDPEIWFPTAVILEFWANASNFGSAVTPAFIIDNVIIS